MYRIKTNEMNDIIRKNHYRAAYRQACEREEEKEEQEGKKEAYTAHVM